MSKTNKDCLHENEGQKKSSIDINKKTIVLKTEADASGKRLHPCFVTCVWDHDGGKALVKKVALSSRAPLSPDHHH